MGWATQKGVLKKYRMLTKGEALFRRITLSCALGLLFTPVGYLFPCVAYISIFTVLVMFFYLLSGSMYKTALRKISPEDEEMPSAYGQGSDAQGEKLREESPVYVLESTEDKVPDIVKNLRKRYIERSIRSFISLIFAGFFSCIVLHLYKPAYTVPLFMLSSGAVYFLCDYLIQIIESKEFAEYPQTFGDRLMLKFHSYFAYSRGYYFIGEVNGKRIGLPRLFRFLHALIGGPTGEGKSSSLIILPLLFDADSPGSALVPDAKSPELFYWVAGRWIKKGKKVVLFDPWHPDCCGINPIPDADDQELQTIVEALLKEKEEEPKEESFFRSRAKYLLYSVLKLIQSWSDEYCNLPAVYRAVESVQILNELIKGADPDVRKLFADFELLSDEAKINALTSIRDKMDIFMDEDVRKAFCHNGFKLEMLFSEKDPCLLIIGAPIDKKQQGSRIASLLSNLVTNLAFKERRLMKQAMQKQQKIFVPNDLYLYADELRNLKIAQLPDLVSIAREIKMQVICSVTDLDFLKYYGKDFGALMANLRTKIFLGGLDYDSCEYISKSLGKEEAITYGLVRDDALSRVEQKLVLEPEEVHNMAKEKIIVFTSETEPFIANKVSIYNCRWARKMHVAPPRGMRPYYEKWGFYAGPLADTMLPKKDGYFDLRKLKGSKQPAKNEDPLTLKDFEDKFDERGGGRYRRSTEDMTGLSIGYYDEEDGIVGIT